MIVRISNEGQYRLDDGHHHRLDELDDTVVQAVAAASSQSLITVPPCTKPDGLASAGPIICARTLCDSLTVRGSMAARYASGQPRKRT